MPEYRLQALLDLRERASLKAEQMLLDEKAKLNGDQRKLEELLDQKQRLIQRHMEQRDLSAKQKPDSQRRVLEQTGRDLAALEDQICGQRQIMESQERAIGEAEQLLEIKSRELEVLQRHKERWLEERWSEPSQKPERGSGGVREELVFIREMAGQAGRSVEHSDASTEIPGLDITPDNLRHSGQESQTGKESSKARGERVTSEVYDARALAARIIAEAERDAELLRAGAIDAIEKGRREGYEQGAREAAEFLAEAREIREKLILNNEPRLIKLALKVAEMIVGHELDHDKVVVSRIIGNVLETVRAQHGSILISVHPADLRWLEAAKPELMKRLLQAVEIELQANPDLQRGGCLIKTEAGTIDARLETQFEQITQILLGKDR